MKRINVVLPALALVFCAALGPDSGLAATYYVDQGHSSASDGNAGLSENAPWLTLKRATETAAAGDTVIVKAGIYTDSEASGGHPYPAFDTNSGSAGNYIVFKSEPALAATVQARGWTGTVSDWYLAWGIDTESYVEIDGFMIVGGIRAYRSNHITIKNCEVIGGFHPPSDTSLLWGIAFEHSTDGLIQNNYVHDLLPSGNSSHNTACVMVFGASTNNVIEYNSVDGGPNKMVYNAYGVKAGGTDDCIWRYNYGHDVTCGFFGIGNTAETLGMYRSVIHNNVIVDAMMFIDLDNNAFDFQIYNNTLYNADYFVRAIDDNLAGLELWNNLADEISAGFIRWHTWDDGSALPAELLDYSDHNVSEGSYWYTRRNNTIEYSLAQWIANTVFGDNSDDTYNPNFVAPGADNPEAYKRTSYPADGRGGSYAPVIGAYVTGDELIGYTHGPGRVDFIELGPAQ